MAAAVRARAGDSTLSIEVGERRAVISGIGQSRIGRRLGIDPLALSVEAALTAIADAGLERADIDGVATYPGALDRPPGFAPVGIADLQDALRLELSWYAGGPESPGQLGAVVLAALAIAGGLARHVLCFRTVAEGSAQGSGGRGSVTPGGPGDDSSPGRAPRMSGFQQWMAPFGAPGAATWTAMAAARHFHEFGTTREQLAGIALTCRANAALNPAAIYREPLTLDQYMSARMIAEPLCLYDCDVPCDGSTAIVLSHVDTAADLRREPVRIEAAGTALRGRAIRDQWSDLTTMGLRDAAAMLWNRSDLRPGDVDLAQLYDGFSFIALCWLEALGFCKRGEAGAFVADGKRIARDGELPLNTGGGQLSGGRLHGFGLLHEAVVQLRGDGGERQVDGSPEVAVVANGGPSAGCLLLTGWRGR